LKRLSGLLTGIEEMRLIDVRGLLKPKGKKIIFLVAFLSYVALLWMVAKPYFGVKYDYQIGEIAQENIVAPKQITYINEAETKKRIEERKSRVPPVFDLQTEINMEVLNRFNDFLEKIDIVGPTSLSEDEKANIIRESGYNIKESVLKEFIRSYKEKNYRSVVMDALNFLIQKPIADLPAEKLKAYSQTGIIVRKIEEAEIIQQKLEINEIVSTKTVKKILVDYLRQNYSLGREDLETISAVLLYFIKPNLFYNPTESQRLINEEISKIEPVRNTIKKGAVVVRQGEEITEQNLPKIEAIVKYTSHFNLKAIAGIGILLLLLIYLSTLPFIKEQQEIDERNYILLLGFTVFTVFYAYLITLIKNPPSYLFLGVFVPTAGITITAEVLFKRKVSFTLAIMLPIFLLLISGNDPYTMIFSMGSGLIALYVVSRAEKRSDLLKSSLYVMGVNLLILVAIGLLRELKIRDFSMLLVWGMGNGLISVIFSMGIIPFFEIIMNLPTNFRLLELADLNNPILKKLQMEAPGTYHHSINVANMAEMAARYIRANPLLVRVAGLYHDIGKLPNAEYYIENTLGESKHSNLKPTLSNSILKAHVKIGVEMAKSIKLPKEVVDIIAQHHGTTLMKYFYHQALKTQKKNGGDVDKQDFHYQGPKPQTREAAIVMLADAVEATSRTLKNPAPKRIEELVNEIIESKFREGQLNESTLTLRDLMKISVAFRRYLTGVFHTRIDYPDEKEIEKIGQEKT